MAASWRRRVALMVDEASCASRSSNRLSDRLSLTPALSHAHSHFNTLPLSLSHSGTLRARNLKPETRSQQPENRHPSPKPETMMEASWRRRVASMVDEASSASRSSDSVAPSELSRTCSMSGQRYSNHTQPSHTLWKNREFVRKLIDRTSSCFWFHLFVLVKYD